MSVTLSQLHKKFVGPDGSVVPVVDIEHFSLGDREQGALVGTSGSGKTTWLHLIAGILRPLLLPGFTALENVLLGMSFTGRAHHPKWAAHLLQEVGLGQRLHYKPQ